MTYLGESWSSLTLTSGQISNWPFVVKMHMVWCVSTGEAWWCLYISSISTRGKIFADNFYRTKLPFYICWSLETKLLTFSHTWFHDVTKGAQYLSDALFVFPLAKYFSRYHGFSWKMSHFWGKWLFLISDDLSFNMKENSPVTTCRTPSVPSIDIFRLLLPCLWVTLGGGKGNSIWRRPPSWILENAQSCVAGNQNQADLRSFDHATCFNKKFHCSRYGHH